jgi:secreted trypsin-like serine protease
MAEMDFWKNAASRANLAGVQGSRLLLNRPRALTAALAVLLLAVFFAAGSARGAGDTKILGGSADHRTDNGWVTAILFRQSVRAGSQFDRQFCTGSLISARWVLTAGHCVTNDGGGTMGPGNYEVLIGEKNLATDPTANPGEVISVVQVLRFPGYSPRTLKGDSALLKLAFPSFNEPVQLAQHPPRPGTKAYIAGWGDRTPDDSSTRNFPTALQSAFIRTISDRVCARSPIHGGSYNRRTMFCAGTSTGRPDTCKGDSGGPIAIRKGGIWRLIGDTSYGLCGRRPPWRGVYAKITAKPLKTWIASRIP